MVPNKDNVKNALHTQEDKTFFQLSFQESVAKLEKNVVQMSVPLAKYY